jgi:very-short-patch-repair endonuclease
MKYSIPSNILGAGRTDWEVLLSVQAGIADRGQALSVGFTRRQIAHRLRSGNWQRVYPGVYAVFTGPLPRQAQLWAAVRHAGDGAMLSHETAAEVHGFIDKPMGPSIHVTVPLSRRPARTRGITIHRSAESRPHLPGPFTLPRTKAEDTVLDLVAAASTFEQGYAWIVRSVSRKVVTVSGLRASLTTRSRVRWRSWLNDALQDAVDGAYSTLERRYLLDVERAHGLPKARRQSRHTRPRPQAHKTQYRDSWYAEYRVIVEIDGPDFHRNEQVQRDNARDNANLAADGVSTFRFGPVDVTEHACQTAAMVAAALRRNGWRDSPRPCHRVGCACTVHGKR